MKNRVKSWCSLLLIFSMVFSLLAPGTVQAAEPISDRAVDEVADADSDVSQEAEVSVTGSDSVGTMIADEINQQQQMQSEKVSISGLIFEGNQAKVEFNTDTDADLVVAVYDEQKIQMLASGKKTVSMSQKKASIQVDIDKMPEYYVASAFLLDKESHNPLCGEYTTRLYTKNMKKLQDSTPDDYDENRVLRLDENNQETNFAVYNESTLVAETTEEKNHLEKTGENTYQITNPEKSVFSLEKGDTFSTKDTEGNVYLIKIAEISTDDSTVTIREDTDTDLTDYFDYVKIEVEGSREDCRIDDSNLEEGITRYPYTVSDDTAKNTRLRIDKQFFAGYNIDLSCKNDDRDDVSAITTIKGSVFWQFNPSFTYFITEQEQYIDFTVDYAIRVNVKICGTIKKTITLGPAVEPKFPWLHIEWTPKLVFEASGETELDGTLAGRIGGSYNSFSGACNKSTVPSWYNVIHVEATRVFLGFEVNPTIGIINKKRFSVNLNGRLGIEARPKEDPSSIEERGIHQCKRCYAGTLYGVLDIGLTVNLLKGKKSSEEISPWGVGLDFDLVSVSVYLVDFYFCVDHWSFGFGTCPDIYYCVDITIIDKNGKLASGHKIRLNGANFLDADASIGLGVATETGIAEVFIQNGEYHITASDDNRSMGSVNLSVRNRGTSAIIKLNRALKTEQEPTETPIPGSGAVWSFNELSGTLYIGGSGEWDGHGTPAYGQEKDYYYNYDVERVVIGSGITSLGKHSFEYYNNLESITIPGSVNTIGNGTFYHCTSLKNVSMSAQITSIGASAFEGCTNLESITLPQNLKTLGAGCFAYCCNLNSIRIPDGVDTIEESTFTQCTVLKEVRLSTGLEYIEKSAFNECINLEKVEFFDKLQYIEDGAFAQCAQLTEINIPASLGYIGYRAFYNCTGIEKVYIKEVAVLEDEAFELCLALKEIEMSEVMCIQSRVFRYCESLVSVRIPSGTVAVGDYAFEDCKNAEIDIPDGISYAGYSAFENCENLKYITIAENVEDIEGIAAYAFRGCKKIKSISIPEGLTNLGNYAFEDCISLTTAELPKTLIEMGGHVFENCTNLKSVCFKNGLSKYDSWFLDGLSDARIYYPEDSTFWEYIVNEKKLSHFDVCYGGENLTLIPYNPDSWAGFPDISCEVTPETPAEEKFTSDTAVAADFGDGSVSTDGAELDQGQKEFSAEEELLTEDDTTEEEFITEVQIPAVVYDQEITGTVGSSIMYTDRKPQSFCLFVAVRDTEATDLLAQENLLYISQKITDKNGEVTFTYGLKENYNDPVFCVFGEEKEKEPEPPVHTHTYGKWQTVKKATVFTVEKQTRKCSGCGRTEIRSYGKKLAPILQTNVTSLILKTGQSTSGLKVTKMAAGDSIASWKSGNKKIIKVSGTGKITASQKTGTTTVIIKLKSGISRKIKIKVQKAPVKTTKIKGLTNKFTLRKGKTTTLKPVLVPFTSAEKITYTSSDKKVVTVSNRGVIKAQKAGKARITVRSGSKKYIVTVTVTKK